MVKKIIIRFVSGFLILLAMVLMDKYFNTGLIFTNVNAKSCGYSASANQTVINGWPSNGNIQTYQSSGGGFTTLIYNLGSSDNGTLTLNNHDYYELLVPFALSVGYWYNENPSNPVTGGNVETLGFMGMVCTQSNGCYNAEIGQGILKFRIDKNVKVTNIRLRFPAFYLNFVSETEMLQFGNIWTQYFYDCSDDDLMLQEQQQTNDLIEDDSIDTNQTDSDINNMNNKVASNGSITQLLTLPVTLYQSILNATNGSCSPISLGNLYGHSLSLPCINLSNLLGSTLYNIIDILCSGLFILAFRKKMVDIFNHMTSLNDRGNELE